MLARPHRRAAGMGARVRALGRIVGVAWLAALLQLAAPAVADETLNPGDEAAIRQVIESQIAAFARDDGVEAFSYASPNIRAMFGSPERFMSMVRTGYPSVYRPRQVAFSALRTPDGAVVQGLIVLGPDGLQVLALYFMERQPAGDWRIDGVQLLPLPERAT